jgi:hypothetical protein
MKRLLLVLAAMAFGPAAFAAGIDSRAYSCSGLHALIAAQHFVFIGNPEFQDFAVANASFCHGPPRIQVRSVATSDNPQCPVNYCVPTPKGRR